MNKDVIDPAAALDSEEERGTPVVSDAQRQELRHRLAHHRAHPEEPTVALAEIRKRLGVE